MPTLFMCSTRKLSSTYKRESTDSNLGSQASTSQRFLLPPLPNKKRARSSVKSISIPNTSERTIPFLPSKTPEFGFLNPKKEKQMEKKEASKKAKKFKLAQKAKFQRMLAESHNKAFNFINASRGTSQNSTFSQRTFELKDDSAPNQQGESIRTILKGSTLTQGGMEYLKTQSIGLNRTKDRK